jgi:phospholipase D1/2
MATKQLEACGVSPPIRQKRQAGPAREILVPARNCWKSARAEASGVLVDAAAYYRAFYEAASQAKKTIILSGWQFDRGVPLLRGQDAPAGAEVRLLAFLNQLCENNPELEIYILAWDFNVVFALEREWMQTLYFQWATNERLQFRFDEAQAAQGSHHQKFAVIDRSLSFLGGIDLCEARWDDRRHQEHNPLRVSRGEPAKPYHDVQAYLVGCETADLLREVFVDRWARSAGPPLVLPASASGGVSQYAALGALPLGGHEVAFSRTDARGPNDDVREVEALLVDAISAAERLIYIETQYFSSRAVGDALISRMRQTERTRLQIVIILNDKPEAVKEEIAIGLRQAKTLTRIAGVARETGHALGVYGTLCEGEARDRPATYIHSKLLLVDDRFLTVGSANLTNRSMGVDTELNVAWEARPGSADDDRLVEGIRRLRVSLLAEHAGLAEPAAAGEVSARDLADPEKLVELLDRLSSSDNSRLTRHIMASPRERLVMKLVDPEALPFDPAEPDYDEDPDLEPQSRRLFIGGLSELWDKLKPNP